jgi:hypothetical protein
VAIWISLFSDIEANQIIKQFGYCVNWSLGHVDCILIIGVSMTSIANTLVSQGIFHPRFQISLFQKLFDELFLIYRNAEQDI